MAGFTETHPTPSPEKAVRSFREDLLAGSGYEDLIDSATIQYVRYDGDNPTDITVTSGNIVSVKTNGNSGATIYSPYERDLLATDETYLTLRVCPPEEIADLIATLEKRSPGSERVTLEVDITPKLPTGIEELLCSLADVGTLTERNYGAYLRVLGRSELIEQVAVPDLAFPLDSRPL